MDKISDFRDLIKQKQWPRNGLIAAKSALDKAFLPLHNVEP